MMEMSFLMAAMNVPSSGRSAMSAPTDAGPMPETEVRIQARRCMISSLLTTVLILASSVFICFSSRLIIFSIRCRTSLSWALVSRFCSRTISDESCLLRDAIS